MIFRENLDFCLVIAPHTDDMELGVGGTVAKLISRGISVGLLVLSDASHSLPKGFATSITRAECYESAEVLGIDPKNISILDFPVRRFSERRQEILEMFVSQREQQTIDLVFVPSRLDFHQDHSVVTLEAMRAFKSSSILGYEMLWNQLESSNDLFVQISEEHLERKIDALQRYSSQRHKPYFLPEFIRSLALVRGVQANMPLAESFEVIRIIDR